MRSQGGIIFLRGYDSRLLYPTKTPKSLREFRGLGLRLQSNDYAMLFFHTKPNRGVSLVFIVQDYLLNRPEFWRGYGCISRREIPHLPRSSRLAMEKVNGRDIIRLAHEEPFCDLEDLREDIAAELRLPGL